MLVHTAVHHGRGQMHQVLPEDDLQVPAWDNDGIVVRETAALVDQQPTMQEVVFEGEPVADGQ